MQIFARITKVDEATGKVYGRAVQEVPDRSGEIFDYESSKPNFQRWSTEIAKATDGKSVGNVRAMHGKVAAGKLSEITFVDAEKAIDVCAEIVDPIEREKCVKGVYTGFSVGGRYGKKWADESNAALTRYTAEPAELSLVDLPCIPTAQFTVVKADGTHELRKFETVEKIDEAHEPPGEDGGEFAPEKMSAKAHRQAAFDHENQAGREEAAGNADAATSHRTAANAHEYAAFLKSKRDPNAQWKSTKAQHWTRLANADSTKAGRFHNPVSLKKDAEIEELEKIAPRKGVDPKEGEEKYGSVEYADPTNKKYPIDTASHIHAAWNYIHMPRNAAKYSLADVTAIKSKIIAAWKAKIDPKGPPEAQKLAEYLDGLSKLEDGEALFDELADELFGTDLAKAGRKHTRKMREHRKMIAEHLAKAKEHLEAMSADDPMADDDGAEKLAKASGELAKISAERDALKVSLDEINAAVDDLKKQVESQPLPPKGVVTAVEKSMGLPTEAKEPEAVMKADGSLDHAATALALTKLALKRPLRA